MSKKSSTGKTTTTKDTNRNDYNKYRDSNTHTYSDKSGPKSDGKRSTEGTGPRDQDK